VSGRAGGLVRETTEKLATDPDPGPVEVLVADLPAGLAFGFITPEGERVCIVDHAASGDTTKAHQTAHKAFWKLQAP